MRKMMFIVAVLAMACMLALPTFAQDSTVFCGTLAAADCDLLKSAQTAMEDSESGAVDISGSFVLQGIPDTPDITIGLGGSATYAIDTAALETLTAQFEGMDETNADAAQIVDGILGVLQAVNGTLVLNITLPADIAQQAGIASDTITLDMAFVGGTAYFNFDALDAATGGMLAAQNMTGVGGINVVEVAQLAIEQDPSFLEQMQSAMSMAMSSTAQSSTMTAEQMAFAEKYITISRTDGGSGEAVFISTVDMAGLFADPEFMTAMQAQMAAQGNEMDDATFQQAMGIVQLLGDDMTMEIEQHIDPASSHTTYTGIKLNIDAATLLQLMGTPAEGEAVISFDLALTYSGFNSTTVTAPAGAQVADSAMVVQMLVGTMGAGQ